MVLAKEIGWGKYRQYEGPYYPGKTPYVLPASPTPEELQMAVITATEGGRFDAWNGYDACGWTSGLIQWCERNQYSVSDMLGAVFDLDDQLLWDVFDLCKSYSMAFKKNAKGRYRFHFLDGRGEVDSQEEQRQLFYTTAGKDGTIGSWDAISQAYAKLWAATISSVWERPEAQRVQVQYTVKRLSGFLTPYAKSVFATAPSNDLARGLYAAYLSFAANNPTHASNSLKTAAAGAVPWTYAWVVGILRELTFGPGIAIYPHRYDKIRPVVEQLYNLNLPDFAADLKAWESTVGIPAGVDTGKIQRALILLGYDLGPKGADGVYGKKTTEAVLTLEQLSAAIPPANVDGQVDRYTWPALQKALADKGLTMPA